MLKSDGALKIDIEKYIKKIKKIRMNRTPLPFSAKIEKSLVESGLCEL